MIKPGEAPADKVLVLEDTDHDGKADKSTIFADGLLIPTGVAPGDGGAYVANSTEVLHLIDTDGDGKADQRRVVLSGFGTEDTHHIIHTFRWGLDGRLYFNQSIYIHSHVETPHGVRRLIGSGVWRFRPENGEFDVVARGMVNPWGHAFDEWGQSFHTDGAGDGGIHYVFHGAAFPSAVGYERVMHGLNPGSPKYCGLEIVSGRHLPDDWQGSAITNDFRANRIVRFKLVDEGGTYVSKPMPDVITSTDVAFRPIDVKMGPDGAIYIADWYNPIINHGEVDFRDPRRDKTRGRIWRITAKGRPLVKRPTLVGAPVADIFEQLKSPEGWTRQQAKLVLRSIGARNVVPALQQWVAQLDANDPRVEHHRVEALWAYQTLDTPDPSCSASCSRRRRRRRGRRRRESCRIGRTVCRMRRRCSRRVSRTGIRACASRRPRARAAEHAARDRAGDDGARQAEDPNLDYALWLTAEGHGIVWMPAFKSGQITLQRQPARMRPSRCRP
jgi:hypothetical protein